jgi:hypothetical protein
LIKVENTKSGRKRFIHINSELSSLLLKLKSEDESHRALREIPRPGKDADPGIAEVEDASGM